MPERTARRRPRPGTILLNHWDGSPGSLDDGSIELDSNIVLPARSGDRATLYRMREEAPQ